MSNKRHYCLQVESDGANTFCGLNDAYAVIDTEDEPLTAIRTVNEWIMPEDNALSLYLQWPEEKEFKPGEVSVKAELFVTVPGATAPRPGEYLARMEWPRSDIAEEYPYRNAEEFDISEYPGSRFWERAEVLDEIPTEPEQREIVSLVEKYRQAILQQNYENVVELANWKYTDDALANGYGEDAISDAVETQVNMVTEQGGIESEPLELPDVTFYLCCRGTLLRVVSSGRTCAFEIDGEEAKGEFDVYVGKVDGEWVIAR